MFNDRGKRELLVGLKEQRQRKSFKQQQQEESYGFHLAPQWVNPESIYRVLYGYRYVTCTAVTGVGEGELAVDLPR